MKIVTIAFVETYSDAFADLFSSMHHPYENYLNDSDFNQVDVNLEPESPGVMHVLQEADTPLRAYAENLIYDLREQNVNLLRIIYDDSWQYDSFKNGDKVLSCGEVVDVDNQPVSLHITGEVIDNLGEDLNGDNIYKVRWSDGRFSQIMSENLSFYPDWVPLAEIEYHEEQQARLNRREAELAAKKVQQELELQRRKAKIEEDAKKAQSNQSITKEDVDKINLYMSGAVGTATEYIPLGLGVIDPDEDEDDDDWDWDNDDEDDWDEDDDEWGLIYDDEEESEDESDPDWPTRISDISLTQQDNNDK